MKKLLWLPLWGLMIACNGDKKDKQAEPGAAAPATGTTAPPASTPTPTPSTSGTKFTVDGKEISLNGSLLVTKDKKKMQPGSDYLVMLTSSGGPNQEGLILNFLMGLKPGTYPVVGMSLTRGPSDKGEVYGGLMGGEQKMTKYNVTITECRDLGSNNMGGHRWSISGTFDDLTIPAMGIMLLDKERNHPAEVKIEKGSFSNLTFDDNWEEMMEKAMKGLKENK